MVARGFQQRLQRQDDLDWSLMLSIALAWEIVFVVVLLVKPGGESAVTWFDDIALLLTALGAAAAAGLAALRDWGSRSGLAWACVALGLAMNAFGEGAWAVQELLMGKEDIFPSVADIGYLGLYPLIFVGLLMMPQAPAGGLRRLKMGIDVLIGILAVAVISSYLIVGDLLANADSSAFATGIGLAYPLADVAVIFAVLVLIGRAGRSTATGPLIFLAAGFTAMAFSDSLYTYLTQVNEYSSGSYIDAGWVGGYSLVTLSAALVAFRAMGPQPVPTEKEHPGFIWQPLVMYAPVVPLAALLLADRGLRDGGLLPAFIAVVALMFGRQMIAHQENVALNKRLVSLMAELQGKMRAQTLELWQRRGLAPGEDASDRPMPAPTRDWM